MSKVKSLEELMKIKEEALQNIKMRESGKRGKIVVAMGTCGIAAGAKDTLKAVVEYLNDLKVDDISVVQSGCMGLCEVEPTIEVAIEGQEPIVYGHVTPENARRIIQSHVLEGKIVSDLIVKRGEV
ncbi:MAG TPA: (2Fe-2S) ferredoxin domain-containing protein [Fervidobacterium sp.]|nr:2Fe-2S ferredoxin [Fervidobacterium sp.]HOK87600.1 (2Fe-2S) ferredoxin domain-containing protein [Fervidobacterium sp.]HOM73802.1 (2Fe-2S) ferredoxin domain-containing protein [Fervidobacterium sp.]HOQ39529.1 (2Fe-2S) ferredoxin domain-containing protein [Fervidobacterium sp.]HPP17564.1 (2Fe-2S) ferredoxin domain-containing protein [Fervidobacterium sp.]